MSRASDPKMESIPLTAQQRKKIMTRSTAMIDNLSDIAVEIVADFIENSDCAKADTIMLHQPEILAVKALEQASRMLLKSINTPGNIYN